jgi:hypothetical protein
LPKKNRSLRLHIVGRVVELLDPQFRQNVSSPTIREESHETANDFDGGSDAGGWRGWLRALVQPR